MNDIRNNSFKYQRFAGVLGANGWSTNDVTANILNLYASCLEDMGDPAQLRQDLQNETCLS